MNIRLQMLQVARLAPKLLGESGDLVREFLLKQQNADGGFRDRDGKSDLYYTVFGLDGLLALSAPICAAKISGYLEQFGDGKGLDFVHLCCLARCWGTLSHACNLHPSSELQSAIAYHLYSFRAADGGFSVFPNDSSGSVYAAFLAVSALQDLQYPIQDSPRLVQSLKLLEKPGGWANDPHTESAGTNPTAAAVVLLHSLGMPVNTIVGDWLLKCAHGQGGFLAAADTPLPDLLSTATALHALTCLERDLSTVREQCLDFVDSLWTNEGSFYGHWSDDQLDCEYTYYGLLSLGNLTL